MRPADGGPRAADGRVSIVQRTREIGIRKAAGARRRDVAVQFLTESVTISGFGVALAVAVVVGIVFGTYPAMRAARLTPVEAIRHE